MKDHQKAYMCDVCGKQLSPTDNFCSKCGSVTVIRTKNQEKSLPDIMRKGQEGLYELTKYGAYEDTGLLDKQLRRKRPKTYEELIKLGYKPAVEQLPAYMKKGNSVFERTKYGSYIDLSITDGIAQVHGAKSYEQLLKLGYR
jgi:ribosomal protein L40E